MRLKTLRTEVRGEGIQQQAVTFTQLENALELIREDP